MNSNFKKKSGILPLFLALVLTFYCSGIGSMYSYLDSKWYTAIEGGYFISSVQYRINSFTKDSDLNDYVIDVNGKRLTLTDAPALDVNKMYGGGGGLMAVGYNLYDSFRADVAFSYYLASAKYKVDAFRLEYAAFNNNQQKNKTLDLADPDKSGYKGTYFNAQCLARLFFDILNPTPVVPFIGIGLGIGYQQDKVASTNGKDLNYKYNILSHSDKNIKHDGDSIKFNEKYFAAVLNLGASYQINPEIFLYLNYALMRKPDSQLNTYSAAADGDGIRLITTFQDRGAVNQSVSLGLRYNFN